MFKDWRTFNRQNAMYIGGPSEHVQTYVTTSGKSGGSSAAPQSSPAGATSTDAAPFISPVMNFNYQAGIAVLEFRDSSTGEVKSQFPSKKVVQEYIRHGAASQDAPAKTASAPAAETAGAPVAAAIVPAATPVPAAAPAPAAPVAAPVSSGSGAHTA
jgi:hypothetical protein